MAEISKINVGGTEYDIEKDVFWATYGATTGAEITAAVNAGKVVLCEKSDINAILPLALASTTQYMFIGEVKDKSTGEFCTGRAAISKTGTTWQYSIDKRDTHFIQWLNRTTRVIAADTSYTNLMARGEKLLDATTFDAVTDWSAQLVNGAIAWRYS